MRFMLEAVAVVLIAVMMLGPLSMAPAYGPYVEPGTAEEFEAATTPLEEGSSNVDPNDGVQAQGGQGSGVGQSQEGNQPGPEPVPRRSDGASLGSQTEEQTLNANPPPTRP